MATRPQSKYRPKMRATAYTEPLEYLTLTKLSRVLVPQAAAAELHTRFLLQAAQTDHTHQLVLLQREPLHLVQDGAGHFRAHVPAGRGVVGHVLEARGHHVLGAPLHQAQLEELVSLAWRGASLGSPGAGPRPQTPLPSLWTPGPGPCQGRTRC